MWGNILTRIGVHHTCCKCRRSACFCMGDSVGSMVVETGEVCLHGCLD